MILIHESQNTVIQQTLEIDSQKFCARSKLDLARCKLALRLSFTCDKRVHDKRNLARFFSLFY
jgi:hypothetical protein